MRAVIASRGGGPEVLTFVDRPDPVPGPRDLLVRTRAIGVNRSDVKQRQRGRGPVGVGNDILGIEFSGEVLSVGSLVTQWQIGDQVCGLVPGGAYAELAVIPAAEALPLPAGVDIVRAAAVPEAFLTSWENMIVRGRLSAGEHVLIHGGSSGIGTAAIQLAVAAGAQVAVTAATEEKLAACRELGATTAVPYRDDDFVERLRSVTDGRGVDVILDIVGADYLTRNLEILAEEGRLVLVSLLSGGVAPLEMSTVQAKRLTITGSRQRSRTPHDRAKLIAGLRSTVWPDFDTGRLRPVVDSILPWADVAAAHRRMEASQHIGKLVLTVG